MSNNFRFFLFRYFINRKTVAVVHDFLIEHLRYFLWSIIEFSINCDYFSFKIDKNILDTYLLTQNILYKYFAGWAMCSRNMKNECIHSYFWMFLYIKYPSTGNNMDVNNPG